MDSVASVTQRIYDYILDGQPTRALQLATRYDMRTEYKKDLQFILNCALAAARSKQPPVVSRQLIKRYLNLALGCAGYHMHTEGNFWHTAAAMAESRGNPAAAYMMYQWVLELDPGKNRKEAVEGYMRKLEAQMLAKQIKIRPRMTREELVKKRPRHRA